MPNISICNPIQTLGGQVLFPAGSLIHEDAVLAALEFQGKVGAQTSFLSTYGSFQADTIGFLKTEPYCHIFSSPERLKTILLELEKVSLPVPLLETIQFFKQKDLYTYRHFCMVFALSTLVAKDLAVEERDFFQLAATGPTHDIGKICVPSSILQKQSPLTREEKQVLNEHCIAGYVLLRYFFKGMNTLGAKVALEHHERRDRSGFPRSIELADPMVEIIAACDIYDALISPRPYRTMPYDNRTALEELCTMAEEGKIGREIVQVLIAYNRRSKPHYLDISISSEQRGTPPVDNNYGVFSDE